MLIIQIFGIILLHLYLPPMKCDPVLARQSMLRWYYPRDVSSLLPTNSRRVSRFNNHITWTSPHGIPSKYINGRRNLQGNAYLNPRLWTVHRNTKLAGRSAAVDFCSEADGQADVCKFKNCYYCCSDDLCHINKLSAPDCFDRRGFCDNYCQDWYSCVLNGCSYDPVYKSCIGRKGAGEVAFNYCGGTVSNYGVNFKGLSTGGDGLCNDAPSLCTDTAEDMELYRGEAFAYHLRFIYRILDDANYELRLYFCDNVGNHRRNMNIYLNDALVFFYNHDTNGRVRIIRIRFDIKNDVQSLYLPEKNVTVPVTGGSVTLYLKSLRDPVSHAILNAAQLKKLS